MMRGAMCASSMCAWRAALVSNLASTVTHVGHLNLCFCLMCSFICKSFSARVSQNEQHTRNRLLCLSCMCRKTFDFFGHLGTKPQIEQATSASQLPALALTPRRPAPALARAPTPVPALAFFRHSTRARGWRCCMFFVVIVIIVRSSWSCCMVLWMAVGEAALLAACCCCCRFCLLVCCCLLQDRDCGEVGSCKRIQVTV